MRVCKGAGRRRIDTGNGEINQRCEQIQFRPAARTRCATLPGARGSRESTAHRPAMVSWNSTMVCVSNTAAWSGTLRRKTKRMSGYRSGRAPCARRCPSRSTGCCGMISEKYAADMMKVTSEEANAPTRIGRTTRQHCPIRAPEIEPEDHQPTGQRPIRSTLRARRRGRAA